ncbi:MAG: NADH-quinone oxidoreductase subunit L [Rickettsiaceae bacterium]|nr:MAG: NADH-quinone oxidoreductase subunit L [Rickettsiaceae bacterium]
MIILINLLPLFSFVILNLFGRFLGRKFSLLLSVSSLIISFFISLWFFFLILDGSIIEVNLYNWISNGNLKVNFSFVLDGLSIIFCLLISFITSLILIYSVDYLNNDPYHVKFFSYLNFFAFSMLTMVMAKNYLVMFLGWEGVGLASYLLVNFWDTRNLANKSALKAVIFNRIGDVFFFALLAMLFMVYGSFDFCIIFPMVSEINYSILGFNINELISFFIIIAAMAKSAQLFLHPWLPDAMEGPTPVSALLHSATMVTAGLFLILRSFQILNVAPYVLTLISVIGLATSLISSFTGLYQYDIKRIIAFSTCSQLGFILFSIGLGNLKFGLFHLFNHAFFKALLFLCAGSVIHACGEQDIRKMGGLWKFLPLTYICMLIASLSLAGFPFLSGYYSKDLVLQGSYSVFTQYAMAIAIISALSSFLSSFYSFRLIYFVFFGENHNSKKSISGLHEGSVFLYAPLIILCILSIVTGFLFKDIFILSGFFKSSLVNTFAIDRIADVEFIPDYIKLLPTFSSLFGILVVYIIYQYDILKTFSIAKKAKNLQNYLVKKFFFDPIYYNYLYLPSMKFNLNFSYKILDKGLFERLGPYGLYNVSYRLQNKLQTLHTNLIYQGLIFVLTMFVFFFLSFYLEDLALSILFIILYDFFD